FCRWWKIRESYPLLLRITGHRYSAQSRPEQFLSIRKDLRFLSSRDRPKTILFRPHRHALPCSTRDHSPGNPLQSYRMLLDTGLCRAYGWPGEHLLCLRIPRVECNGRTYETQRCNNFEFQDIKRATFYSSK